VSEFDHDGFEFYVVADDMVDYVATCMRRTAAGVSAGRTVVGTSRQCRPDREHVGLMGCARRQVPAFEPGIPTPSRTDFMEYDPVGPDLRRLQRAVREAVSVEGRR
jgi:hypothetical protein